MHFDKMHFTVFFSVVRVCATNVQVSAGICVWSDPIKILHLEGKFISTYAVHVVIVHICVS